MTRSNSVKNAAIVQEAGAGEEDGEDDAPPAVDSRFSESTSEEDLEVEDTSGPAPTSRTPESAPAPMEMAEESPDPAGEIPAVDVGTAAEPDTRKHKNGLGVDGVDEEPSTGAASVYTIPKKKDKQAETAAKPSDPVSVAWNGHRVRESGPVTFENGLTFLTVKALGTPMADVPTETPWYSRAWRSAR